MHKFIPSLSFKGTVTKLRSSSSSSSYHACRALRSRTSNVGDFAGGQRIIIVHEPSAPIYICLRVLAVPAQYMPSVPQPQTEGHLQGQSLLPSPAMVCALSAVAQCRWLGISAVAQCRCSNPCFLRSRRAPHSCPRVRCVDLYVIDGPSVHHGDQPVFNNLQSHGTRAIPRLEDGLGGLHYPGGSPGVLSSCGT